METNQQSGFQEAGQFQFLRQNLSDVGLVPYSFIMEPDGWRWTVSDEIALGMIREAMTDGSFASVFVDGAVTTPEQCLVVLKKQNNIPAFFFVGKQPIGVAWINGCSDNRAFGHFMFLRRAWGKHTAKAGKIVLDYWFSFRAGDDKLFDVILGVVPSQNTRAVEYVKKLGFVVLGDVPKMLRTATEKKPATIVYLAR